MSDQLLKKAPKSVGQTGLEQLPNECAGFSAAVARTLPKISLHPPAHGRARCSNKRQSVLQTADQVIGMFDSDRNADGPLADSGRPACFEGHRGV